MSPLSATPRIECCSIDPQEQRIEDRFFEKMSSLPPPDGFPPLNWSPARVVTIGTSVGYRTSLNIKMLNGVVQLFHSKEESQGLIKKGNDQVVAASVTTSIRTIRKRSSEKKSTHIQYDKRGVYQSGVDFQIIPENKKGKANYEGGHLIDHKFSAEDSHTTEGNYIPELRLYNSPIKEYLVQRSEAYVEIPLYTSTPPTIALMSPKGKRHPVPVGIVFIQINNNKIDDVYYFPNNINYENLKEKLNLKKGIAKGLLPLFKLKESLYPLFKGAIITDIESFKRDKAIQLANEDEFFSLMQSIAYGMTLVEPTPESLEEKIGDVSSIAFSVLHGSSDPSPGLFLSCDERQQELMEGEPMGAPFKALGEFVIKYCLRNSLKAEVVSIYSRLSFAGLILNFLEASDEDINEGVDFVNSLTSEFKKTLEELDQIKETMNKQELFFYVNLYRRLSSPFLHSSKLEVYFDQIEDFFSKFINALECLCQSEHFPTPFAKSNYTDHFIQIILDAQYTFSYLVQASFLELFKKEQEFLKSIREPCLRLIEEQGLNGYTIESDMNRVEALIVSDSHEDYVKRTMENLGEVNEES